MLVLSQYPEEIVDVGGTWGPGHAVVVVAAGYFGYDILNCIVHKSNWTFIVHGAICFTCYYLVATYHAFEKDSIFYLSWEISTIVLNLVKAKNQRVQNERLYKKIFFVLFFVVRIVGGYGYTFKFVSRVWSRLFIGCDRAVVLAIVIINCIANGLNTFWFTKLVYMAFDDQN